jgi:hypothetical protein
MAGVSRSSGEVLGPGLKALGRVFEVTDLGTVSPTEVKQSPVESQLGTKRRCQCQRHDVGANKNAGASGFEVRRGGLRTCLD